jgi:multiple sugar transport system substrate-binding protein
MKKHWHFLAVMAVCAIALAGCSASAKKATITWGYWGSPSEVEENKAVAAEFEKANPGITIEHMTAPWGDYFTKLQTQFAGKTAPDVMFLTFISTYAPMGVLADMGPLFKKNKFDVSKYPQGVLDGFTVGGKLYGLPRDNDTKVVFVNKRLFAEAGIQVPTASWTTDDFAAAAKKLTKKKSDGSKQYGLMFDPGNWFLWVFMAEGRMFDDDAKPSKVQFDAGALAGLQYAGDLIHKYKATPDFDQLNNGTVRQQLFMNGQVAMLIDNHSQVPSFLAAKGLEWDVAPLPTFPGKAHHNVAGGAGYAISAFTKQPDAAWKFWLFLNTKGVEMYMKSGTMVPVNPELQASADFSGGKPYNAKVFIDETASGHGFPGTPAWWNVYSAANPFLERVWAKGESAAEAVSAAQAEMDKQLKK